MQLMKKMLSCFLTATLLLGLLLSNETEVKAATKVPDKVRIHTNMESMDLNFSYAAYGDKVINIKTSSKNLKAKVTYINQETGILSSNTLEGGISLYASKKGKYTVSFDMVNASGTLRKHYKVTVYAFDDAAIKSVTVGKNVLDDTQYSCYLKGSSGKVTVKLNSGYKLKKIEYGVWNNAKNEMVYKTIRNMSKIKYSTTLVEFNQEYSSTDLSYHTYMSSLAALTELRITYIDKYSRGTLTESYYLYKLVK